MILGTIATGSKGNCHYLKDSKGKILLLDAGISIKEIKRGIDYNISDVIGAVVSHGHLDHSKSVKDLENLRIPVFKPYEEVFPNGYKYKCSPGVYLFGDFTVKAFDLTDKDGKFVHTNADGSECPCYGFLIQHPEMGKMIYATDCEFIKWQFKYTNHILIGCNYQNKYVGDNDAKKNHVLRGHMELETVKEFVKANKSNSLRSVTLCHMSLESADPTECMQEVQKVADCAVYVAEKGMEIELRKDVCPF